MKIGIKFCRTAAGGLAADDRRIAFRIALAAVSTGERGYEITGTVTIDGVARRRPFQGHIAPDHHGHTLFFTFTDDEFSEHSFSARIAGNPRGGEATIERASVTRAGDDQPWAEAGPARLVPEPGAAMPFRIRRIPARPRYRDALGSFLARPQHPLPRRATAVAMAETAFPAGNVLDAGGEITVARLEKSPLAKSRAVLRFLGAGFMGMDLMARVKFRKRFAALDNDDRLVLLQNSSHSPLFLPFMLPFFASVLALKYFNIASDEVHEKLGTEMTYGVAPELDMDAAKPKPAPDPAEPWEAQIVPSARFESDEVIEADAVVIGSGAGGGPVAKELAERGFAVAVLEEGRYVRREDPTFGTLDGTVSLGNAVIVLPRGKVVGGTTFINAGTCFRTPDEVLMKWVGMGMDDFHPDRMARYFDGVEEIIHVEEADPKWVGPVGEVVRKGCEALGYHSHNLRRNCPNCEGKALCSMGCPHGAKLSTNRSYIPAALKSKASLFPGFRVRDIIVSNGRAIGVHAFGPGKDGKAVRLTVFARAVALAAGALLSPPMIQRNGLARGNKWVGRNLTFHPATGCAAVVPGVEMKTHQCIPQGYCVDQFRREGLMFEGANVPLMAWAALQKGVGKKYIEMVEKFPNMANFGFMVEDTSTGRIRPGIGDRPFVTYWMNKTDFGKLVRGAAILSRIFLAAGAERVFAMTLGSYEMASEADVRRFESRRRRPRDFILSAYHCLGTARVGPDAKMSALDMDHQLRGVPGLFVVDGSSVPTSVGVNPQETIMAVATRAGERIARILEE